MKNYDLLKKEWLTEKELFSFHCPYCDIGLLCNNKKFLYDNFDDSELHYGANVLMTGEFDLGKEEIRPWGEFAEDFIDVHYIFSCILSCNNPNCQKKVLLSGDKAHDYTHHEDISRDQETGESDPDFLVGNPHIPVFQAIYKIEYFSKPPNIFLFPENLESKIEQTLLESFRLFWIDKKSCLNRLRLTIEILLEKQGFPKNNERETLGSIIERYSKAKPQVGDLLKAIKWAGNDGSHYNTKVVTKENLLSIYMILEEVVKKLYDDSEMKIKNLAHNINTNKGL